MLVIKIELWPGGSEEGKTVIHEGRIGLVSTENGGTRGNYKYRFSTRTLGRSLREGYVEGFPRRRLSAWDLLYRCLRDAVGERNARP